MEQNDLWSLKGSSLWLSNISVGMTKNIDGWSEAMLPLQLDAIAVILTVRENTQHQINSLLGDWDADKSHLSDCLKIFMSIVLKFSIIALIIVSTH
ncbi:MAG TPA: hypothetical protein PKM20_01130 [Nitrosomonas sp.]|nr:hypothetical protein [Nitrosomonas sp.]